MAANGNMGSWRSGGKYRHLRMDCAKCEKRSTITVIAKWPGLTYEDGTQAPINADKMVCKACRAK